MGRESPERQRDRTRQVQQRANLSTDQLWLRYFSLGGTAGRVELDAYLNGALDLPAVQRDRVALAVNEHVDELTRHRAPYSQSLREIEPETGPLAALIDLLHETHLAPPEDLPSAVDRAAEHLGLTCVLYLSDYAKEMLVPMPGKHGQDREAMPIDSTLAGRAYQLVKTQPSAGHDGRARLWMPVINGAERLGVLDVMVAEAEDLHDPHLLRQCWTLTHYTGHLVTVMDRFGDAIDAVRRSRPRTVEADLVWSLLPPLTAGTDKVLVSGRIEPAYDMGGDVFDYGLSAHSAMFTVMDATGHDLRAGLAAATALAAYRNARRQGRGLFAQAESVHDAVSKQFTERTTFVTGVLADLNLDTGRLRYLAAGHPPPLLLRRGKVVKQLTNGRRPLLGMDLRSTSLGEEQLQKDDIVVLYSDGITEARNADREQFGVERLIDAVELTAADGLPLPEMTRRLFKAILRHQESELQDDATVLLVQWSTEAQRALEPVPRAGSE